MTAKDFQMKFQDISRKLKEANRSQNKTMSSFRLFSGLKPVKSLKGEKNEVNKMYQSHQGPKDASIDDEWDKEHKREGLEEVEINDLTTKILKNCNITRDRSLNAKILLRKTGVVCGARKGSSFVNEPIVKKLRSRIQSALPSKRLRNNQSRMLSIQDLNKSMADPTSLATSPQSIHRS